VLSRAATLAGVIGTAGAAALLWLHRRDVRHREDRRALAEVSEALADMVATDVAIAIVVKEAHRLLKSAGTGLWLLNAETRTLQLAAQFSLDPQVLDQIRQIPLDAPAMTALGARTGQAIEVVNLRRAGSALELSRRWAERRGAQSGFAQPLVTRGRVVGVLTLHRDTVGRLSQRERELARALADISALGIERARLYEELKERAREAEVARQQLAELLEQARDAMAIRDRFLAAAAHELRTPLTSLRGFAQLESRRFAKDGTIDPQRVQHAFDVIDKQTLKMAGLVNQLLDASRIESGRLALQSRRTDLVELVRGVVEASRHQVIHRPIELCAPPIVIASIDPTRIEQVITNLIDNAIKYSPENGEILVSVVARDDQTVQISVRDHGIGIPPEHRGRIFDRFYRGHDDLHYGGMGLGLFISRQIVELHHGQLVVEAPPDGGSLFIVTLPLNSAPESSGR
jgi:signal transduction histidine kinase